MDVFTKVDVYGPELEACSMLRRGFARAEGATRARAATYIDLSR